MSRFLPLERPPLHSPVWFVPFDEFAGRVRTAGVEARLERLADGGWLALDDPAVRTPSGAIAYPRLGRRGGLWTARPRLHRVRFAAPGLQPLYPADGVPFSAALDGVEFTVQPYDPGRPPGGPDTARLVRLLPAVTFAYPPRVRTVHGTVRDAVTGAPAANALVESDGRTSRDRTSWHERTLTDASGAFRLALRWEGVRDGTGTEEETFRLRAAERPGRAGSLVLRLPRDGQGPHVIEIREN
ncbi:carboxypeptidase-like regulatory domain-containing protein [Streptomyces sp. CAU 1734]|uniref:carboxypeptidase-like regulatory domain-containing protein n=1 Tax=Streptomyces sp. CAU 1734 TaxID=3140360 RepID=UPI0032611233